VSGLVRWFREWRLFSWRSAVVAAVVLYTVVGFFIVPRVVESFATDLLREQLGREVTIEEIRVNPYTLSLTVRGFALPDGPDSTLLAFDELYANAELSSLFRWALTLKELRIDNPYAGLRRFSDGRINVVELADEIERRSAENLETAPDSAEDGGLPRIVLQHILVDGAIIEVEDYDREEPVTIELGPSVLELNDISTIPLRKGDNEFAIRLKEGGTIRVSGEVVVEPLGLDGDLSIDKLLLERTWPLLQPYFEFDLEGGTASGRFHYSVELHEDGLHARIDGLEYRLTDLLLEPRDADDRILEVDAVSIAGGHFTWPEANVGAAEIKVEGAGAFAWLEPDGSFGWNALVPQATQAQVAKTYHEVEDAAKWTAAVDRVELLGASVRFEDRTFDEPVSFAVDRANVTLTGISTEQGSRWGVEADVTLLDEATATAQGEFGATPLGASIAVAIANFDLASLQPYIERFTPLELVAGKIASTGRVSVDSEGDGPLAVFSGELDVERIDLRETAVGSRLLQWGRVEVRGIEVAHQPQSLTIGTIDIYGAGIDVVVSQDGKFNLIELLAVMAEDSQTPDAGETATQAPAPVPAENEAGSELPPIRLETLTLHGCSGVYTDRTTTPPFTLGLDEVDGTVNGVSSRSTTGSKIEIDGIVSNGGNFGLDAEVDVFDPARLTDITIDVRQVDMPPISPMLVRYLGHPAEDGQFDLGLEYEIVASELNGNNRIVTQDFKLGDKVEGEGMVDLPLKLGLSLLTDKNGRMDLEFPIEGNIDDPGFGIGNAMSSAIKEISRELLKSPFRLLGKLGGGKEGEDYRYVEFEAGSSELRPNAVDKLRVLAEGAGQRPGLLLQIAGVWDEPVDSPAMQEARVEAMLVERVPTDGAAAESQLDVVVALASEQIPQEQIAALREQSTSTSEDGTQTMLDETKYYRALREALIAVQTIEPAELEALAGTRAEAIHALLVDELGADANGLQLLEPAAVEKSSDDRWVRLELEVAARN
jgi:hypothetical protein